LEARFFSPAVILCILVAFESSCYFFFSISPTDVTPSELGTLVSPLRPLSCVYFQPSRPCGLSIDAQQLPDELHCSDVPFHMLSHDVLLAEEVDLSLVSGFLSAFLFFYCGAEFPFSLLSGGLL